MGEQRDLFGATPAKSFTGEMRNVKQKVMHLLSTFPEARNNDNLLIRLYWQIYDNCVELEDIDHATRPEVIRRWRQKLNEQGLFLPSKPEIANQRRRRRNQYEQHTFNI